MVLCQHALQCKCEKYKHVLWCRVEDAGFWRRLGIR